MAPDTAELLKTIAYLGLMLGVLCTVVPVVPGPWVVWGSALLWAWADGFRHVGWPTLVLLALLAGAASVSDLAITAYGGRRTGASWTGLAASACLGAVGFVLASLPGAIAGSIAGVLIVEWHRHGGDWRAAWRTSRGVMAGWVLSFLVELALVLVMVLLFTIQAFGPA